MATICWVCRQTMFVLVLLLFIAFSAPATAKETGLPSGKDVPKYGLETLTVTADKREKSAHETPTSLSIFSDVELEGSVSSKYAAPYITLQAPLNRRHNLVASN